MCVRESVSLHLIIIIPGRLGDETSPCPYANDGREEEVRKGAG